MMACLVDIRHPACHDKPFGKHFLIIGTMIGFTKIARLAIGEWKKRKIFEHLLGKEYVIVE